MSSVLKESLRGRVGWLVGIGIVDVMFAFRLVLMCKMSGVVPALGLEDCVLSRLVSTNRFDDDENGVVVNDPQT